MDRSMIKIGKKIGRKRDNIKSVNKRERKGGEESFKMNGY